MLFSTHHSSIAADTNSGPLSERIFSDLPRHWTSFSSSRITLWDGRLVSTVMESASRLKSSITFSVRIVLPLDSVSCIKSRLQVILGPIGHNKGAFTRAGKRFLRLFLRFSRIAV